METTTLKERIIAAGKYNWSITPVERQKAFLKQIGKAELKTDEDYYLVQRHNLDYMLATCHRAIPIPSVWVKNYALFNQTERDYLDFIKDELGFDPATGELFIDPEILEQTCPERQIKVHAKRELLFRSGI